MEREDRKARAAATSERLRQIMEQKNVSRETIAGRLETSVSNIAIWSSGMTPLNRCRALALEAACNFSAEWLLTGKGSQIRSVPTLSSRAIQFAKDFDRLQPNMQKVAKELMMGLACMNPKHQQRRPGRPSHSSIAQMKEAAKAAEASSKKK